MSHGFARWFSVAVCTLIVAGASSSEPPGTAKPVPESEKAARLDLPAGALARLGVRQAQPDGRILLAAFSPDGKRVALCGRNDTVTLWDVATGKQVREFEGLSPVYCFAFSPDGKYLATGNSDRSIHLWEVSSGKERRELAGQQGGVSFLSFSPDGKTLASGDGGAVVRLWAVATGKELLQIAKQDSPVVAIAFLPDGKTLASAAYDGSIRFCETATGKELRHIDAPQVAAAQGGGIMGMGGPGGGMMGGGPGGGGGGGPGGGGMGGMPGGGPGGGGFGGRAVRLMGRVNCFSFSPDGKLFGAAYQGQWISIRESATGRELHQVASADTHGYTYALSISPDGRTFATAGMDGKVRLWEVASGKQRRQFKLDTLTRNYPVGSVAFAPDGRRLISSAQDNSALVWDVYALKGEPRRENLQPDELQELWTDLACDAASTAYAAVCQMIAAPEPSVPFLRERLRSAKDHDGERIAQLIADLDSNRFDVREKAMTELAKLPAEPALRKTLAGSPSLEVRRRIDQLLENFRKTRLSADQLREIRVAEILEHIGNPASQAVLKELANGAAGSLLAEEAKSALARLAKRPATER